MNCTQSNELMFDYIEGLMDDQGKQALEAHIETCATCRQALKDMQALQTRLTEHGQKTAQTELETHVLGAIVRGQKKQLQTATPQTHYLRRSIMKNPIAKLAIAATIIVACTLGFILMSNTQSIALADVLTRMEQVRAYLYQMNMTITHSGDLPPGFPETQDVKCTGLMSQEYGTKLTMDLGVIGKEAMIQEQYLQPQNKRMLMIMPGQKTYVEMELNDQMLKQYNEQSRDPRHMIEKILKCDYQKIGKSTINGIEVEGFQTTDPAYSGGAMGDVDVTVWVDAQTWLPVQVDMDISMKGERNMHMQGKISDFQWDVSVDASEFNPIIPADYTTIGNGPIKMPDMTEETAISGLKHYREYTGQYPEDMGMMATMANIGKFMDGNTPAAQALKQSMKDLDQKALSKTMIDLMMPIQGTAGFYSRLVQDKKNPAYYGDIVTPDQPDLILMRWQIEEGQYRVIFSDLTTQTVTLQGLAELENALPERQTE